MKKIYSALFLAQLIFCGINSSNAQNVPDSTTQQVGISTNISGSRSTVPKEKTGVFSVTNFTQILEGKSPGLLSTNFSGQPGAEATLSIRGFATQNGISAPLIVLDAAPFYGDPNAINPSDIESIEILKDGVSTMRYGGLGANGVINVKTKKGKFEVNSKPKLSIEVKMGLSTRLIRPYKTIDTEKEYYELAWQSYRNGLMGMGYSRNTAGAIASGLNPSDLGIVDLLGYNSYNVSNSQLINPTTGKLNDAELRYSDGNWNKAMQQAGLRQEYLGSLSGGGEKTSYYFSTGYLNENGYLKNTGYERFTSRLNGEAKPWYWLKTGTSITIALADKDRAPSFANTFNNPFFSGQLMAPIYPVHYYNAGGEREQDPLTDRDKYDWGDIGHFPNSSVGTRAFAAGTNYLSSLENNANKQKSLNWSVVPYIEATILQQFKMRTQLNYYQDKQSNLVTYYPYYPTLGLAMGRSNDMSTKYNNSNLAQTLNWKRSIKRHNIEATVGYEINKSESILKGLSTTQDSILTGAYALLYRHDYADYFANALYNYDEKYFLTIGYRKDFNRIVTSSNSSNFLAVGGAWKLTNETFLKDVRWMNELMLKTSYAVQGNIPSKTELLMAANYWFTETLKPPSSQHFNLGIFLGMIDNRLSIEAYYYARAEKNTPFWQQTPHSLGSQFVAAEGFDILNKGIEANITFHAIRKHNWRWTVISNLTRGTSTTTHLPHGAASHMPGFIGTEIGKSIYSLYVPESAGVDPANGQELYYYFNNVTGNKEKTNDYAALTDKDLVNFGSTLPDLLGAFTNELEYKNFSLSWMLTFGIGGKYYDGVYQDLMRSSDLGMNYSVDIRNSWTPENPSTTIPKMEYGNQYQARASSRFISSASYLNVRNIQVSYEFDKGRLRKFKLGYLKLYVVADNLYLLTARRGMNPQASFNQITGYTYSPARIVSIGIKLGL